MPATQDTASVQAQTMDLGLYEGKRVEMVIIRAVEMLIMRMDRE